MLHQPSRAHTGAVWICKSLKIVKLGKNVDVIEETALGEVTRWDVQGGSHAFIVMGSNSEEYKEHVQNFIDENVN